MRSTHLHSHPLSAEDLAETMSSRIADLRLSESPLVRRQQRGDGLPTSKDELTTLVDQQVDWMNERKSYINAAIDRLEAARASARTFSAVNALNQGYLIAHELKNDLMENKAMTKDLIASFTQRACMPAKTASVTKVDEDLNELRLPSQEAEDDDAQQYFGNGSDQNDSG